MSWLPSMVERIRIDAIELNDNQRMTFEQKLIINKEMYLK